MRFSGYAKPYKISGDYGERDPPVPIPNTEVKPFSADGTWLETTWESRTLPDSMKKGLTPNGVGSFLFHLQRPNAPVEFDEVRECTWLGFFLPPAVRDFRQEKSRGRVGGSVEEHIPCHKGAYTGKSGKDGKNRGIIGT